MKNCRQRRKVVTNCNKRIFALFGILGLLLTGCTALPKGEAILDVGVKQRGMASWYGKDFHGLATANGERYDMYAMTAAHRTLPLGTVIRVTNALNGHQVQVRINDRGPYKAGRILDLSFAAAIELAMDNAGVAPVQVEVVGTVDLVSRDSREPFGPRSWFLWLDKAGAASPARVRQVARGDHRAKPVRSFRQLPADIIRERRIRRVADILAVERRVDSAVSLVLS